MNSGLPTPAPSSSPAPAGFPFTPGSNAIVSSPPPSAPTKPKRKQYNQPSKTSRRCAYYPQNRATGNFKNPMKDLRTLRIRTVFKTFLNRKLDPKPNPPLEAKDCVINTLKKKGIIVDLNSKRCRVLELQPAKWNENTYDDILEALRHGEMKCRWASEKGPKKVAVKNADGDRKMMNAGLIIKKQQAGGEVRTKNEDGKAGAEITKGHVKKQVRIKEEPQD